MTCDVKPEVVLCAQFYILKDVKQNPTPGVNAQPAVDSQTGHLIKTSASGSWSCKLIELQCHGIETSKHDDSGWELM